MAHGSHEKYALNLNDIMAFPDAGHMPVFPPGPEESWIVLLEVIADYSLGIRPVYSVKDATQTRFTVALYTPNPSRDAINIRIGNTLCITNALVHQFLDGQTGFRIEDPTTLEVLPVSMQRLKEINEGLRKRSDDGNIQKCIRCNGASKMGCATCKSSYCTRECQTADWREHKKQCRALRALLRWNRIDWG